MCNVIRERRGEEVKIRSLELFQENNFLGILQFIASEFDQVNTAFQSWSISLQWIISFILGFINQHIDFLSLDIKYFNLHILIVG